MNNKSIRDNSNDYGKVGDFLKVNEQEVKQLFFHFIPDDSNSKHFDRIIAEFGFYISKYYIYNSGIL